MSEESVDYKEYARQMRQAATVFNGAEPAVVCSKELWESIAGVIESFAGYRKQSEGEWRSNCQTDEYICSLCDGIAPVDCEKEEFYKSNFCPNCGAHMKGGAE